MVVFVSEEMTTIIGEEHATLLHSLVDAVFRRLSPGYEMASPLRKDIRDRRMSLFNTNEKNTDENGFIKIAPKVDGRLTILK